MKAPAGSYRIWGGDRHWEVRELEGGKTVWRGKTFVGARNAHYRLSVAKITGRPVSAQQARRATN
jgi:hypothetical protein